MTRISNLTDLSFPDQDVRDMIIDHAARRVCVSITGAWLGSPIAGGELVLTQWDALHQRRYELGQNKWIDIPQGQEEPFKDIPEFISNEDQTILRGFGKITGEWLELVLTGGKGEYNTTNEAEKESGTDSITD